MMIIDYSQAAVSLIDIFDTDNPFAEHWTPALLDSQIQPAQAQPPNIGNARY